MEKRFNAVNGDWPPTKAAMSEVVLEAMLAASRRKPAAN